MKSLQSVRWIAVALLGVAGCGRGEPGTHAAGQPRTRDVATGASDQTDDSAGRNGTDQKRPPRSVLLFAAASTTEALNEIGAAFGEKHGVTIRTNYAATPTLAQQIISGAAADVFVSASEKWADTLADRQLVADRRDMLGNELVMIVPTDSTAALGDFESLTDDAVKHVAVGDPESVPAGLYAKQALISLDLWDRLKNKLVSGADVRQALSFVETGAAEAGIVYATDAVVSKRVRITARVDSRLSDPIRYPVVLLRNGAQNATARQFYEQLASPEAAAVFRKYGFAVFE